MIRSMLRAVPFVACVLVAAAAAASEREAALARMREAVAARPAVPDQATTLARLAWPDGGVSDPLLASIAREELVRYGDHAIPALRERLRSGPPIFGADITSALLETRLVVTAGRPADYVPTIDDALWSGSPEAARLAMYAMRPYRFYRPSLLPMIDRGLEHPELLGVAIRNLAQFGDDRARFFLDEQMRTGPPDCRVPAANALAAIGGLALEPLRQATLADAPDLRAIAVDALLPVTTVSELATLFEYLGRHATDDAARVARVQERALHLDGLLQAHQAAEAASPARD